MHEEHPRIAQRDWRLHAITTTTQPFRSPQTGFQHPVGTVVELAGFLDSGGETFGVPVADAAAMFLSLAMSAAKRGRRIDDVLRGIPAPSAVSKNAIPVRRIDEKAETEYLDALQDLVATVIFSYTSIEALANQLIPLEFRYRRERPDGKCTEEFDRIQIERHLSLDVKLHSILPAICKVESPKGGKVWARFVRLERLRNRLIHLKRDDWRNLKPEEAGTSIWSDVIAGDVSKLYVVAVDLAAHFTQHERPRWVERALRLAAHDAA